MADITGAHIFSAGTWNNMSFSEADLDQIVTSFESLALAGRVPLKFGHNDEQPVTDGQPAIGWVSRIWRQGSKLLADFSNVPTVVFDMIKRELYKFVSVELLREVKREGVTYPSVLDAVALLGADPPAVTDLDSLSALTWSRKETGLRFKARLAFTQGNSSFNSSGVSKPMDKKELDEALSQALEPLKAQTEELRVKFSAAESKLAAAEAENAKLKQQQQQRDEADRTARIEANKARFIAITEGAVKCGAISGADRTRLREKFMKDDESILSMDFEIVELAARHTKDGDERRKMTAFARSGSNQESDESEAELARVKIDDMAAAMRAAGDRRDIFSLTAQVLRHNPKLAAAVHGTYLAGDRE